MYAFDRYRALLSRHHSNKPAVARSHKLSRTRFTGMTVGANKKII